MRGAARDIYDDDERRTTIQEARAFKGVDINFCRWRVSMKDNNPYIYIYKTRGRMAERHDDRGAPPPLSLPLLLSPAQFIRRVHAHMCGCAHT